MRENHALVESIDSRQQNARIWGLIDQKCCCRVTEDSNTAGEGCLMVMHVDIMQADSLALNPDGNGPLKECHTPPGG